MTIRIKVEIKELLDSIKNGMYELTVVSNVLKDPRTNIDAESREAALEVVAEAEDKLSAMELRVKRLDKVCTKPSLAEMSNPDPVVKEQLRKMKEAGHLATVAKLREQGVELRESTNNKLKEITGIDFIEALKPEEPEDLAKIWVTIHHDFG